MPPEPDLTPEERERLSALLADEAVRAVFAALEEDNARIVGGAVRNAILGEPVADIDFATTLPPEEAMKRLRAAGFSVHPVGIEHGSIIAAADGRAFEVTTLRRDVKTDGRHAIVAFTTDWAEDAQRRDFTMNALYLDATGRLHDHVRGLADARARRLRFIGDAARRIREDYLRILRFFRFWARYGQERPDAATLATIRAESEGLRRISKERIRQEVTRLLVAPRAVEALRLMDETGVLALTFPADCAHDFTALESMAAHDAALALEPDWFLRLVAFCGPRESLRDAFRLTREEMKRLRFLVDTKPPKDEKGWQHLVYRHGKALARDLARLAAARDGWGNDTLRGALAHIDNFNPPRFLLTGGDAVALGVPPGPAVGAALRTAEERFIENGFSPADREGQLALLRAVIAGTATSSPRSRP